MVRDRERAFVGSQSLRRVELERRREVGIVCRDRRVASRMARIFEDDWELARRLDIQRASAILVAEGE